MLYIFPALLFILNRFILNPRHIGTLFRLGIRFAGPQWHTGGRLLAEEQLEAGLCPVGGQGPWKLGLFQVGNQPVRTSHGNMISLLTSLNENLCSTELLCSQLSATAKQSRVSRAEQNAMCTPSRRTFQKTCGFLCLGSCGLHVQSPVPVAPCPLPFSVSHSHKYTDSE